MFRSPVHGIVPLLVGLVVCVSCKSEPVADGGDVGTDSNATAGTGTTEGTGETAGTDETDGADGCDGFADAVAPVPVQITVRNDRAEPVYLLAPEDCTDNYVHVSSALGHWPSNSQEQTCAASIAGDCMPPGACQEPFLLRIEPGGEYPLDWYFLLITDTLPEACVTTDLCPAGDCPRAVAPPDGSYTIDTPVAFAPPACEGIDDPCVCPPGDSWCLTNVYVEGLTPDLAAEVMATLPVNDTIVIAIE